MNKNSLITSIIGAAIFILFAGGLAVSIGAVPFYVIVALVSVMFIYDLYQSLKSGE